MPNRLLGQFNLNLLKAFYFVYQYRNITKAAKHLNMTQGAVSKALNKLRLEMDDPLFVITGKTLAPTSRAERLGEQIEPLLNSLEEYCFPSELFDPLLFTDTIKIALSGGLIDSISPSLVSKLHRLLPKAQIKIHHWSQATLAELENGNIDIGINHYPLPISKGIRQLMVTQDPACFLMRQGHPILEQEITLEEVSHYQMAGIIIPELTEYQAIVQTELKSLGLKFALRSEHIASLFKTVAESDLLLISTGLAASTQTENLHKEIPEWAKGRFSVSVAIYLQQIKSQNPMHQWLVKHIKQVILTCVKQANI
ncbi:LysR family transcriptional regulator [Thalassotalea psychrophila]|uniref:LysR family transcriptional regulator n=1 Tax=Thalassotalea psychrophila TaxID=3065647 RepID=A0ABY9TZ70_9GAMM|nr:LysR family transcriptional regulator [Colwelliaceae bacterium SQ149]